MNQQIIPLDRIHPHPANSNVMPEALVKKLAHHIESSGRYPPLVVRPIAAENAPPQDSRVEHSGDTTHYQILDGHHRVLALKQIGRDSACCSVWEVDDDEALLLLATLNRLQGQDDPIKRSRLLNKLSGTLDVSRLSELLPERREQVCRLLELSKEPAAPKPPKPLNEMPAAVHFFLLPDQKRKLDAVLKSLGGTREQALLALLDHVPSRAGHSA